MATAGGPYIERSGLVFSIDSSSPRSYTDFGTSGTNNSYRDLIDLAGKTTISLSTLSTPTSGNHYTLYGITYPEGSYSPAARDGITPGFNNISSTKLYDCSRDLNYFVFDENTNTWVADSYFNGERIDGHCYDTYDGAPAQHATFQADFDNIAATFPNATHIVIGSHAAENNDNDANTLSRLQSIGLPDSHIGVGRPEYILVGKIGKPHLQYYVRENVSAAVAHLNLTLPLEGDQGHLVFDGTDDYIAKTRNQYAITDNWSVEVVFKPTNDSDTSWNGLFGGSLGAGGYWMFHSSGNLTYYEGYDGASRITYRPWTKANTFNQNVYHHLVITYTSTGSTTGTYNLYYNGGEKTDSFNWTFTFSHSLDSRFIGAGDGRFGTNDVHVYKEFNRVLTPAEVQQNYNAYKNRFNL